MKDKEDRIREWINTGAAILGVIFLIIGTVGGLSKLGEINENLDEIKTPKVSTQLIELTSKNSNASMCLFYNGTGVRLITCE